MAAWKLTVLLTMMLFFSAPARLSAQAPTLSYPTPNTYLVGTYAKALSPLTNGVGAYGAASYNSGTQLSTGFNEPYAIAVDQAGNTYVADTYNNRVVKIPKGGGTPVVIGSGFTSPVGVAVDAAGNVYVGDNSL